MRLAVGIRRQQLQRSAGVPQSNLQRVVIGVADGGLERIAAEIRTQRPSGPVDGLTGRGDEDIAFVEWTARRLARRQVSRIAKLQTKPGIAGIGFFQHQKMMRL